MMREPRRNALLDSLRAIAVFCVLLHHWTDWGFRAGLGQIGVQTFFVISGFLITRILLTSRMSVEMSPSNIWLEVRSFFVRRSLRIFPIYYLLLVAIFIIDRFGIRETFGWHALYMSNLYFFSEGRFDGPLSHLWTLSVEEQYYLVWPWIILFAPRKWLVVIFCLLIVLAPTARALLFTTGHYDYAQYNTLVFSNLDSLGCGALLSWAQTSATCSQQKLMARIVSLGAPVSLVIMACLFFIGNQTATVVLYQLTLAIAVSGLVQFILSKTGCSTLNALSIWPIVYLGRISYGIYLYHMFAPNILNVLKVPEHLKQGEMGFLIMLIATLSVASASWFAIERPIILLKTRFSVGRGEVVPVSSRAS